MFIERRCWRHTNGAENVRPRAHSAKADCFISCPAHHGKIYRFIPLISAAQEARTLAWYTSRTCASCDADRGRGLRDGIGSRGGSSISGAGGAIVAIDIDLDIMTMREDLA